MPNFAIRLMIVAACLTAGACTEKQAPGTASPTSVAGPTVVDTPGSPESPKDLPAPTLATRAATLDGLSESPLCALDSVNALSASEGRFTVSAPQPIVFEGWVAMSNLENPGTFSIILDGKSDFEITHVTGVQRPDVADAYGSAALASAGFQVALPALEVPADEYSVMISHEEAGAPVVCKTNLRLVVTQ